jgi:hypothetical protein
VTLINYGGAHHLKLFTHEGETCPQEEQSIGINCALVIQTDSSYQEKCATGYVAKALKARMFQKNTRQSLDKIDKCQTCAREWLLQETHSLQRSSP